MNMRVGICGCGQISERFVGSSWVAQVEVTGVYNHNLEKAQAFAEKYQIGFCMDDYDAFLQSDLFDTVYLGIPNSLHYEYAMKALKAGKHVINEKPFCSNVREFDELVAEANKAGRKIIEFDRVTTQPNFEILKQEVGNIGHVETATVNFCQYSRKYDAYLSGVTSNVFTAEFSGGALYDLGIYGVNVLVALFGMPKSVSYVCHKIPEGVDITGTLIMKYDDKVFAIINSKNTIGDRKFNIMGTEGSLFCQNVPLYLHEIYKKTRNEEYQVAYPQEHDSNDYALMEVKRIIESDDTEAYRIRLIQSRKVMTVLEAARKSAGIIFKADER